MLICDPLEDCFRWNLTLRKLQVSDHYSPDEACLDYTFDTRGREVAASEGDKYRRPELYYCWCIIVQELCEWQWIIWSVNYRRQNPIELNKYCHLLLH